MLAARLKTVMSSDIHQQGKCYRVRSLYFDDAWNSCLDENEAGVDSRKKYRIRLYDTNESEFKLEIKEKYRGYTSKASCLIERTECHEIINGKAPESYDVRKELNELHDRMHTTLMRPKVIIEYERTAFVYPVGNVRITFDRNIRASEHYYDFLNETISKSILILPAGMHVLEVKYDELLPDFIAQLLELGNLTQTAFSKYYLGRHAVQGEFLID